MTNLMHQLQAWANKGWYTFPCEQHPEGDFDGDGWEDLYNIESNFCYNLADAMDCVLNGTIQVWRPVEHYPPPKNAEVLALFLGSENADYEHGIVETNVEKGFTHWQPLPQLLQEVK